jgi:hypothetical protein
MTRTISAKKIGNSLVHDGKNVPERAVAVAVASSAAGGEHGQNEDEYERISGEYTRALPCCIFGSNILVVLKKLEHRTRLP